MKKHSVYCGTDGELLIIVEEVCPKGKLPSYSFECSIGRGIKSKIDIHALIKGKKLIYIGCLLD